jgi:mannitol operon transcriptional antiterminator
MDGMPPILESRQAAILAALLKTNQAIPASSLAADLGLSLRKLRYALPRVRYWLEDHGGSLTVKPHIGLSADASGAARQIMLAELQAAPTTVLLNTTDRLYLLLFQLLTAPGYLKGEDLEEMLLISRGTLSKERQRAEAWLAERKLSLDRRPYLGIGVSGDESDIRRALVQLLMQMGLQAGILALCRQRSKAKRQTGQPLLVDHHVLETIAGWPLAASWKYAGLIQKELALRFSENDHLDLALYLAIALQRCDQNRIASLSEEALQTITACAEFGAMNNMALRLHQERGTQLPASELALLTLEVRNLLCHRPQKSW